MTNKDTLESAAAYFKGSYPNLLAESIVAFLVLIDLGDGASVGDVSRALGMTEPQCYHFMTQLNTGNGAGLVSLENTGDGTNLIHFTGAGQAAKEAVLAALA